MKLTGVIGTAILVSSLAIAIPAFGQHGKRGGDHHKHEKFDKKHGKSVRVVERRDAHRGQRVVWVDHRATRWEHEHRGWKQRGGYHGYRVPRERYVVYFGREHRFRVHSYPVVIVEGRPRFRYHDCWVTMVDPWPEYWSERWYETDDVYVEYADDGYYLYNERHPGVRIAVNISM
ncbi:MAG TPA: hypothetical protein VN577_24095 [Terriglobales bacterium]|nr:hypothetical protein [Terriglobales bacterium]